MFVCPLVFSPYVGKDAIEAKAGRVSQNTVFVAEIWPTSGVHYVPLYLVHLQH